MKISFEFKANFPIKVDGRLSRKSFTLDIYISLNGNRINRDLFEIESMALFRKQFDSSLVSNEREIFTDVWELLSADILSIYPSIVKGFTLTAESGVQYIYKERDCE